MDERARRLGMNEAVFREINERIKDVNEAIAELTDGRMHLVCECGQLACHEQIAIDAGTYEQVRAEATHFLVVPGHEIREVEHVVAVGDGWIVVEKDPGGPAELARDTDPR